MGRVSFSGLGSLTRVLPSFSYLSGRSQKPRIYFSWAGVPLQRKRDLNTAVHVDQSLVKQKCSDGEQQAGRHAGLSQGGGNWAGRQG